MKKYVKSEKKLEQERVIISYIENNSDMNDKDIAYELSLSPATIRKYRLMTKSSIKDEIREYFDGKGIIKDESSNKLSKFFSEKWHEFYDEVTSTYKLHLKIDENTTIEVGVSEDKINALFYLFSKNGLNLSSDEVCDILDMNSHEFNVLKSHLNLYKTSLPVSPIAIEFMSVKELDEKFDKIAEHGTRYKMSKKFQNKKDRAIQRMYEKSIEKATNADKFNTEVLEGIRDFISNFKIVEPPQSVPCVIQPDCFAFGDTHVGKKYAAEDGTVLYDMDEFDKKMIKLTKDMLSSSKIKIKLFFLGDAVEYLVSEMHSGQTYSSVDGQISGADMATRFCNAIIAMLVSLAAHGKKVDFYYTYGNHSRGSKSKAEDALFVGAKLVADRLQDIVSYTDLSKMVNFNQQKLGMNYTTIVDGGLAITYLHGDKLTGLKGANKIFAQIQDHKEVVSWEHSNRKKCYHLIIHGEKHHTEVHDFNKRGTFILAPAICGVDNYAQQTLGLSSPAGYVKFNFDNEVLTTSVERF